MSAGVTLRELAALMAQGLTVREAARKLYVHRNTIYYTLRKHGVRWWPVTNRRGRRKA